MNYQDFLAIIFTPVRYFVNWLSMIANSLMSNYIFLTFLNLTMAISLFYLFYESILFILNKFIYRNLDYIDRKRSYELYKKVQSNYLKTHRNEEFEYLYDSTILRQQVLNGIYRNHPDLLLDNKINSLKLNVQALKKIKEETLSDDDDSNDDDIDYLVPKVQLASSKELHKYDGFSLTDLQKIHEDSVKDINSEVDRIMKENESLLKKRGLMYDSKSNSFINVKSKHNYFNDSLVPDFHGSSVLKDAYYDYKEDLRNGKYHLSFGDYLEDVYGYTDSVYYNYKEDSQNGKYHLSFDDYLEDWLGFPRHHSHHEDYYRFYGKKDIHSFEKHNSVKYGKFAYYDKKDKIMKTIKLPVDSYDLKNFQFDNENLSDMGRDFISEHTLIRIE